MGLVLEACGLAKKLKVVHTVNKGLNVVPRFGSTVVLLGVLTSSNSRGIDRSRKKITEKGRIPYRRNKTTQE